MMSSQYGHHLHNGDDFALEDGYPHEGVTPPGMGWDGQGDGGGKFRLKRRRRCGQCGPCQVKENCNKCQYCMRKDVLKQACVYRKCVYLRKPVPRFRQEAAGLPHKPEPTPPLKPTTTPALPLQANSNNNGTNNAHVNSNNNNNNNNNHTNNNNNNNKAVLSQNPCVSSPASASVGVSNPHTGELSSCRLNQSPYPTPSVLSSMNTESSRVSEQPHRSLFESASHHSQLPSSHTILEPAKSMVPEVARFPGAAVPPSLKQTQVDAVTSYSSSLNPATAASLNSAFGNHHLHPQPSKCAPALPGRDPYFPAMEAWGSMPYALPSAAAWATPTLPSPHVAASYGFQQQPAPFQSSFSPSSCRLGMADPAAARFVSAATGSQHSLHHSMTMAGFTQDFAHSIPTHAGHANLRNTMNAHFYPSPTHLSTPSIHGFPGLSQFSAGQPGFAPAAYSMHPHAHMYPSSFYSFRSATEPQIYHVRVYLNPNPFKQASDFLRSDMNKKQARLYNSMLGFSKNDHFWNEKEYSFLNLPELIQPACNKKKYLVSDVARKAKRMLPWESQIRCPSFEWLTLKTNKPLLKYLLATAMASCTFKKLRTNLEESKDIQRDQVHQLPTQCSDTDMAIQPGMDSTGKQQVSPPVARVDPASLFLSTCANSCTGPVLSANHSDQRVVAEVERVKLLVVLQITWFYISVSDSQLAGELPFVSVHYLVIIYICWLPYV